MIFYQNYRRSCAAPLVPIYRRGSHRCHPAMFSGVGREAIAGSICRCAAFRWGALPGNGPPRRTSSGYRREQNFQLRTLANPIARRVQHFLHPSTPSTPSTPNMRPSIRFLQKSSCRITLFTRENCGLCIRAKSALSNVWDSRPFVYREVDIIKPKASAWRDLYDMDVPVVSYCNADLSCWITKLTVRRTDPHQQSRKP